MTIPKYEKNPYILISDTDSTGLKTIEIDLVGADKEEESSSS